jgi:hypothetical protein
MAVDHVTYVPDSPYNLKLVDRTTIQKLQPSLDDTEQDHQNSGGRACTHKVREAGDTLDKLLRGVERAFQESDYRTLVLPYPTQKHDTEMAKKANLTRLRLERQNKGKAVMTRRDSTAERMSNLFGHFDEIAEHAEQQQLHREAETKEAEAWTEADARRMERKEARLRRMEAGKRKRRAANNLGHTGAYTDDHLRSKPQQVDKEVNMAQVPYSLCSMFILLYVLYSRFLCTHMHHMCRTCSKLSAARF